MGKTNQEMIQKAITSLSFGGGIGLTTAEADRFIDYMVDQSFLKNNARLERMNASTKKIDKIGLGKNILRPGVTGVDPGNTVGISTSQIELKTKEMIAIVEIGDDSLEDNIEGDDLVDHIMKMVAMQASNELEVAFLYGKEVAGGAGNATHITQLFNGWMTRAKSESHVVDAKSFSDRYIAADKLSRVVKTLPNQYRTNRNNLRFLVADDIQQDYSDILSTRLTSVGDPYVQGVAAIKYGNIAMQSVSLASTDNAVVVVGGASTTLSGVATAGTNSATLVDATNVSVGDALALDFGTGYEEVAIVASVAGNVVTFTTNLLYTHQAGAAVKEVTQDGTDLLLTDYRNLILGIQRDIRVETQRDARRRTTSFVLTMRADVQVENPDAMVVLSDLKVK